MNLNTKLSLDFYCEVLNTADSIWFCDFFILGMRHSCNGQLAELAQRVWHPPLKSESVTYTHTQPFYGPFSGTTRISRYQKGKTNLDFTEARDSEWQWHQLGHMQVCT